MENKEEKIVKLKVNQKYYCSFCKKFIAKKNEKGVTELNDKCTGISSNPGIGLGVSCKCGKKHIFSY